MSTNQLCEISAQNLLVTGGLGLLQLPARARTNQMIAAMPARGVDDKAEKV